MCYKQIGLYRNERDTVAVVSFFQPFERTLTVKERTVFYAGLGACREFLKTKEDLEALAQFLLGLAKRACAELKETQHLFSGIASHQTLVHILDDLQQLLFFYLRVLKRSPKQSTTIYRDLRGLIDERLVTSVSQLADVDLYLQEFQFLSPKRYRQYLSLDPTLRQAFLRNHKRKYLAIALGERPDITPEDYDLIWYAVNSKNLTKEIIQQTLQRYGQEAAKLPKTSLAPFDIKDLAEIIGYKLKNPLRKELGPFLSTTSAVLLEEQYGYEEILRKLNLPGRDIPQEILALIRQRTPPFPTISSSSCTRARTPISRTRTGSTTSRGHSR